MNKRLDLVINGKGGVGKSFFAVNSGLPQTASERACDMFLKVRYVQSVNGGGGIVFATGTPIANSMTEMFTRQRYPQPDA